jgi:hypothetical protein
LPLSPVVSPYRAYGDGQKSGASTSKQKLRDNSVLLARCYPSKTDTTCWNRYGHASAILRLDGIHTKILNWLQAHD